MCYIITEEISVLYLGQTVICQPGLSTVLKDQVLTIIIKNREILLSMVRVDNGQIRLIRPLAVHA